MGDNLAELLYAEWRRTQDPSVVTAWGNADQETRESWERVANLARRTMANRFVDSVNRQSATMVGGAADSAIVLMDLRAEWSR